MMVRPETNNIGNRRCVGATGNRSGRSWHG
jgi:hypothetical protein